MEETLERLNRILAKESVNPEELYIFVHRRTFPENNKLESILNTLEEGLSKSGAYVIYCEDSRGIIIKPGENTEELEDYLKENKEKISLMLELIDKNYFYQSCHRVIQEIKQSEDINDIYGSILTEICEIVDADIGAVTIYDRGNNMIQAVGPGYNVTEKQLQYFSFELKRDSFAYLAYENGKSVYTNNASADPHIIKKFVDFYEVSRVCTIPLLLEGEPFGFIYIARGVESYPFKEFEVDMLDFISSHIVSLLKFLEVYKRDKKRLKALTKLEQATRVILSEMNIEKAMKLITKFSLEIVDADASSLMIYNKERDGLIIKASCGISETYIENQFIPMDRVTETYSTLKNKALFIEDLRENAFGDSKIIREEGLISAIGQPIVIDDRLYGMLNLYSKEKRTFDDIELELLIPFSLQAGIAIKNSQLYKNSINTTKGLINALAALESEKDYYTAQHSEQVANLAVSLGKECNLDRELLEELYMAGLLHDIGKISIDKKILLKKTPLSEEEMENMKEHPIIGKAIIEKIPNMERVAECVYYHHERWDGNGYPDGIAGEDIPVYSRILNIADSVAAMLSRRPYREAMTEDDVRKELMKEKGRQFDPKLIDKFLNIF